ncbi:double-stranded RNA-specific adenosine deaminase isoform X3 [Ascaphus truei]|uniref:double-stranded RNA-specific adenosine deaminase isoform X3 n=1 Tax=Ascaphus truei TaxID=8439 RepID=UPI003F59DF05
MRTQPPPSPSPPRDVRRRAPPVVAGFQKIEPEAETHRPEAVALCGQREGAVPAAAAASTTTGTGYYSDHLQAEQRAFLLGKDPDVPWSVPGPSVWHTHRTPQSNNFTHKTTTQPPRYQRPHIYRVPSENSVANLSLDFKALSVSANSLEELILGFFKELHEGETSTALDLAKHFRVPKKRVNHHLYSLERKGLLCKAGERRPFWRIAAASHGPRPSFSHRRQGYQREAPPEEEEDVPSLDSESNLATCSPEAMAENREKVCEYLYGSPTATALFIRKNIGVSKTSEVNQILNELEKQGDVCKETATNPIKWALTEKKRERMLNKKKAKDTMETKIVKEEPEDLPDVVATGQPVKVQLAPSVENGQQGTKKQDTKKQDTGSDKLPVDIKTEGDDALSSDALNAGPPRKRAKGMEYDDEDDNGNEMWTQDDIPSTLENFMDAGAMSGFTQYYEPVKELSRLEKLQACQEKNPVSGLIEFTQFCAQQCDFVLLGQSGPSHDPRFKMQAVIGGRSFPVVEASSKKTAKKVAASTALRVLIREQGGGTEPAEEILSAEIETPNTQEETQNVTECSFPSGKNPICVLMEHSQKSGHACEFQLLSQDGPAHDPKFTYSVKIGSETYPAVTANSKKLAKQLAAEVAVKQLLGNSVLPGEKFDTGPNPDGSELPTGPELPLEDPKNTQAHNVGVFIKYLNANPVSGLLDYSRAKGFAAEFKLVNQTGPAHDPKFLYQAKVGGRWFPAVSASNKKQAKAEAADAALRVLIGEAEKAARTGESIAEASLPVSGSTFHDQIAMLSHQRFNSLTARIQNSLLGRKILAAIIMKKSEEDMGTVVSIGTGNRCVKGEELSLRGETVNDCHAEVISRRGFTRYLYSQMMKYNPDAPDDNIFEEAEGDLLRVRPAVTFHLYISTAPCGDGALYVWYLCMCSAVLTRVRCVAAPLPAEMGLFMSGTCACVARF